MKYMYSFFLFVFWKIDLRQLTRVCWLRTEQIWKLCWFVQKVYIYIVKTAAGTVLSTDIYIREGVFHFLLLLVPFFLLNVTRLYIQSYKLSDKDLTKVSVCGRVAHVLSSYRVSSRSDSFFTFWFSRIYTCPSFSFTQIPIFFFVSQYIPLFRHTRSVKMRMKSQKIFSACVWLFFFFLEKSTRCVYTRIHAGLLFQLT